MMKYVTRLLLIIATMIVAVAAVAATAAPPAVAEPGAPSNSTQAEVTTTTSETPQPETPQPSTSLESTTAPPPSTSTTSRGGVGEVSVTALDLKTSLPVNGVSITLEVDDVARAVTAPATVTMPAGSLNATVTAIPDGYNWAKAEPSVVTLLPGSRVSITVRLSRPELRGHLSITKRDRITGAALVGARYRLTPCQGAVGAIIVTGSDGVGSVWIRHGCYRLQEIQAPAGYALDSTVRTVNLIPTEIVALTLYDTPLEPVMIVRNPGNRVPLASIPTGRTS